MASGDSSNGAAASMKREGTMQRTAREAKEYSYGCNCGEVEGEHDHDKETGQPIKPARQSTMEKTAQEGIQYLKDQRKDTLLEVQGLAPPRANRNKAEAGSDDEDEDEEDDEDDTTEHTGGVGDDDDDSDEPLTGENGHDDDSNNSGGAAKMAKQRTMLATAKEGQELLENHMGGIPDARTRGQQKAQGQEEEDDEDDGPDAKRPRRTHTMQETAQEAQNLVADPHSMGGTRSETAAVKKAEQQASPSGHPRKQ